MIEYGTNRGSDNLRIPVIFDILMTASGTLVISK